MIFEFIIHLEGTVKKWPGLLLNKKRQNATDEAAYRVRGRPKGRTDVSDIPRWQRIPVWAQNNADFAAAIAFLHKQKDSISLKDISQATGYSIKMCQKMLKRTGYRFHLRSYTFQLSETQKAYRKQMAIDFERSCWELPNFIEVRNFIERSILSGLCLLNNNILQTIAVLNWDAW